MALEQMMRCSVLCSERYWMCLRLKVLGQQDKDRRGTCGISIIFCLSIDVQLSKEEDRGFVSSKEMKDKEWSQAISLDFLHWLIVKSLSFPWTFGIGQFYITIWNRSAGFWIIQSSGSSAYKENEVSESSLRKKYLVFIFFHYFEKKKQHYIT